MTYAPKIFVSYSFKSPYIENVNAVIRDIKKIATDRKWIILDPMKEPGVASIREKVAQRLWEADAIFAEITASIPNVSLETGFGAALGCPVVAFVDSSALSKLEKLDLEKWNNYFELIRQGSERPLPSDLGDLEYFSYSSDINSPSGSREFENRLIGLFDQLEKTVLSPSACLLRQNYKRFLQSTENILLHYSSDHPFLRILGGWFNHLGKTLNKESPNAIEIDAYYYQDCLAAFRGYQSGKANAIADLSSQAESFWEDSPAPLSTAVAERIFVMDWKVLFNRQELRRKTDLLREQCKKYPVRVLFIPPVNRIEVFQFGEIGSALGYDLLLIDPDLVGGYVARRIGNHVTDSRNYLRIESNDELHEQAMSQYQKIRNKSLEFQSNWTAADRLRNEWIQKEKIGDWKPFWGKVRVSERDDEYFDKYDMHIRCWIPRYDFLINETVAYIQREIMDLLRNTSGGLKILEIGYGTGALTIPLLQWIDVLNSPFYTLHGQAPVRRYVGIDEAPQMENALKEKIGYKFSKFANFGRAEAWEDCDKPLVCNHSPYNVVFGSLIIHDLLGDLNESGLNRVDEFFERCSILLDDGGCMIFGDSFTGEDEKGRKQQIDLWKQWMFDNGLNKEQIQTFIDGNLEMVNTIGPVTLQEYASKHGFKIKYMKYLDLYKKAKKTPFAIFVMEKKSSK